MMFMMKLFLLRMKMLSNMVNLFQEKGILVGIAAGAALRAAVVEISVQKVRVRLL